MALDNLVNLTTDKYNKSVIDTIINTYGLDAFKGTASSLGDFNGVSWALYILITTIKSNPSKREELLTHFSSTFTAEMMSEKNASGLNTPTLILLAFMNNDLIEPSFVLDILEDIYSKMDLNLVFALKQTTYDGFNGQMVISSPRYVKNLSEDKLIAYLDGGDKETAEYNIAGPAARLINVYINESDNKEDIKSKVHNILSSDNIAITPYPKTTNQQVDNSVATIALSANTDDFKDVLNNFEVFFSKPFSDDGIHGTLPPKGEASLNKILSAIDFSKCVGLKYGETGFVLGSYSGYNRIGINFIAIDILGNDITSDILDKYFVAEYEFAKDDNSNMDGITPLAFAASKLKVENGRFVESPLREAVANRVSLAISKIPNSHSDNPIKKLFAANAILGSCRDFTNGKSSNMFGTLNILFSTINSIHRQFTTDGDNGFDDFSEEYARIASTVGLSGIEFDGYKRWCEEYGKDF